MNKIICLILSFIFLILNIKYWILDIKYVSAEGEYLLISEIQITESEDYIELYNPTENDIDLVGGNYRIERASSSGGDPSILIRFGNEDDGSYPGGSIILSNNYYLVIRDDANQDLLDMADAIGTRDDFTLTESNTIYLGTGAIGGVGDEDITDFVGYGEAVDYEGSGAALLPGDNQSIGRKLDDNYRDTDDNNQDFEIQNPTPGSQNEVYTEPLPEEPEVYSDKIYINEFLPAPGTSMDWDGDGDANSSDEWIEIISLDAETVNLEGWIIDDIEDGGSSPYAISSDITIDPDEILVFYKKDTGIILNNSGDSIILKNPNGEIADEYSYTSSDTDISYSREDNGPGEWTINYAPSPSSLNEPPANEYPRANAGPNIDDVEVGNVINFNGSASYDLDGSIVSFVWDFGDGNSGTGENTTHVYSNDGTYQVFLTITDDNGATNSDSLIVTVIEASEEDSFEETLEDEYENQYSNDIKIIEFLPNPEGNDADGEYVILFNSGSSDVNLRNWVLDDEEGGSKPFAINKDKVIGAGSEIIFERTDTKIAINNSGDSVRLFDPDGELIDSVCFEETAHEGVSYVFVENKWSWEGVEESISEDENNVHNGEIEETINQEEDLSIEEESAKETSVGAEHVPLITQDKEDFKEKNVGADPSNTAGRRDLPIEEERVIVSNYKPIIIVDAGDISENDLVGEVIKGNEVIEISSDLESLSTLSPVIKRPWTLSPYFIIPLMVFLIVGVIKFIIIPKNLYDFLNNLVGEKEKSNQVIEELFEKKREDHKGKQKLF